MLTVSRHGGVVLPPVPAFYQHPKTINDLVDHTVGRVCDQFGFEYPGIERWSGEMSVGIKSQD